MQSIVTQLAGVGLDVPALIANGKIQKVALDRNDKKKSGWYIAFENHTISTGEAYHVVTWGNYKDGSGGTIKTEGIVFKKEDLAFQKRKNEAAKKLAVKERSKLNESAAAEVTQLMITAARTGESEYLKRKKVSGVRNASILYEKKSGAIAIPMQDIDGKFWSTQTITKEGNKRFRAGGKVKGCFSCVGDMDDDIIYLTEGFATACSVHIATKVTVLATFSANNLIEVAALLSSTYHDKSFLILGDDDKHNKVNVGREKAEKAGTDSNMRVVFPVFKNKNTRSSDFNDLHVDEGLNFLRSQIEKVVLKPEKIFCLGMDGDRYYLASTSNPQIVDTTLSQNLSLLRLAPLSFWASKFPSKKDGVAWTIAKSNLIDRCRARGIFKNNNIRGSGVWRDAGRIVVNMGSHLLVDGEFCPLVEIKSKYYYTLGETFQKIKNDALTTSECAPLINACKNISWISDESSIFLAGALVLGRLCGAIPHRPHVWLTGGAETGKTTILERLIMPILGSNAIYAQGGTTEAGIRQCLNGNSVPVIFDEFETYGEKTNAKIESILDLARGSWSDSTAKQIKGSANGTASFYSTIFSGFFSSIRVNLKSDADKGRFTVLELAPHGGDKERWKKLSGELNLLTQDFAERFFARNLKMLPVILENYENAKKLMVGARFGNQYGLLISAYATLVSDKALVVGDLEALIDSINFEEAKATTATPNHMDALEHIKTTKLTFRDCSDVLDSMLIENIVEKVAEGADHYPYLEKALLNVGIRVSKEKNTITFPRANHSEMEKQIWRGTEWSKLWGPSLMRISSAQHTTINKSKINSKTRGGISISLKVFFSKK